MKAVASEDMVRNALGHEYDEMAEPPNAVVPREHALWALMDKALREVYDEYCLREQIGIAHPAPH